MSTVSKNPIAPDEVAPRNVCTRGDTPAILVWHGSAGNDATCEDPAISEDHAEQWDWHAVAPHAFGHAATTDAASSARPTSYEMYHAARAHRALIFGRIIVAAIRTVGAIARRASRATDNIGRRGLSPTRFGGSMTGRCVISASTAAK